MHQWYTYCEWNWRKALASALRRPWKQTMNIPKCQSVPFLLTLATWECFLLLSSRGKELAFSYFFLNLATPRGMLDLSTLTQDGTHVLALKVPCPNHRTSREVPGILLLWWPRRRRNCLPNCEIVMEAVWEMEIFQHLVAGWNVST